MANASSPKRRVVEILRRPEGGPGGTRPVVVPPDRAISAELGDVLLLDAAQVAVALGIGRTKAFQLIARGELPVLRIGRCVRVPKDALVRWISDETHPGSAPRRSNF